MKQFKDYTLLLRLSEVISVAEFLSTKTVSVRNTDPTYPVTVGEKIACYALDIILPLEWSSHDAEVMVEPIESALAQLDTGVDKPAAWNDLFTANKALKSYLEARQK